MDLVTAYPTHAWSDTLSDQESLCRSQSDGGGADWACTLTCLQTAPTHTLTFLNVNVWRGTVASFSLTAGRKPGGR